MNYMNIINQCDNNSTRLKLTTENETNTLTQTISLLTRKVNEINTELHSKVTVLEKNMKDISDTLMTEIKVVKNNENGNILDNDINANEDKNVLKNNYATTQDLNIINTEISKIKSYTLDIYNEVIKMRNVIDTCQAYNAIKNDICNLQNDLINDNNDNNYYLYNSDEWIHTQSILEFLNI